MYGTVEVRVSIFCYPRLSYSPVVLLPYAKDLINVLRLNVYQSCDFFFQAEDGIRDSSVTGVQTCALFFSSRRRHTRFKCDWSSDVCSSDLLFTPWRLTIMGRLSLRDGGWKWLSGFAVLALTLACTSAVEARGDRKSVV